MAKVVVALLDHNVQEGKNLQAYLQEKPDIVWKGWYLDVPQMEKALKRQRPDAIVVSMQDTERDAQMLLALSKADLANKYLLYTSQTDKKWHQQCRDLPIGFVVYKQTPMEVLYQRLLMVAKAAGEQGMVYHRQVPVKIAKQEVATALKRTGVAPKLCGYHYLCRAVELVLEQPDWMDRMTEKLYPTIAAEYESTSQRVERSMRYAVENAFDCGDLKEIERVFGYTVDKEKGKPSNREYIARMADSLRIAQT